jgi:hypothetical protein
MKLLKTLNGINPHLHGMLTIFLVKLYIFVGYGRFIGDFIDSNL